MPTINSNFPGQNAWMAATIPANCIDPLNGDLNGKIDLHWDHVAASGVKFIRCGGKTYDKSFRVAADYDQFDLSLTDMLDRGFTPIIQLSYYDPNSSTPGDPIIWSDPAAAATHLLEEVVIPLKTQEPRLTYFSIGNEPDTVDDYLNLVTLDLNDPKPYTSTAQQIYAYISVISDRIKDEYPDIKVLGPELSSFNSALTAQLTGVDPTTGNDFNILPFIDVYTFHSYLFTSQQFEAEENEFKINATRYNIINVLRGSGPHPVIFGKGEDEVEDVEVTSLEERLNDLNETIGNYNTANGTFIGIAITEANCCYENDVFGTNPIRKTNDTIRGNGARSYLVGQYWAKMMAVGMGQNLTTINFWSVIEGGANNNYLTDIGYISSQTEDFNSTYYHFKMVAENFTGDFVWGVISSGNSATPEETYNLDGFASKNTDGIALMVLNQNLQGTKTVHIRFDPSIAPTVAVDVIIDIDFGSPIANSKLVRITGQETLLVRFDLTGVFRNKYSYNIQDNLNNLAPH